MSKLADSVKSLEILLLRPCCKIACNLICISSALGYKKLQFMQLKRQKNSFGRNLVVGWFKLFISKQSILADHYCSLRRKNSSTTTSVLKCMKCYVDENLKYPAGTTISVLKWMKYSVHENLNYPSR